MAGASCTTGAGGATFSVAQSQLPKVPSTAHVWGPSNRPGSGAASERGDCGDVVEVERRERVSREVRAGNRSLDLSRDRDVLKAKVVHDPPLPEWRARGVSNHEARLYKTVNQGRHHRAIRRRADDDRYGGSAGDPLHANLRVDVRGLRLLRGGHGERRLGHPLWKPRKGQRCTLTGVSSPTGPGCERDAR